MRLVRAGEGEGQKAQLRLPWPGLAVYRDAGSCRYRGRLYEHCATGDDAYWIVLAPFFGVICVITRCRDVEGKAPHWQLIQTHPSLGCGSGCDVSRLRGGRKTNDELGRQRTHGADIVGARDVYGRRPRWCLAYLPCRRRTRPCRSRHRLARTGDSAAPVDSHCIAFDSGAVLYTSSAGARILSRLRAIPATNGSRIPRKSTTTATTAASVTSQSTEGRAAFMNYGSLV
jgi:hypothetical protein